ncbi:protein KINESIN LIGHT CHAIN-RELATED 3 [Andrographis paniculata]|uniref:protein KINESIN LIGHT CHAIN-RELATED 3 n=1 Tax=Andrographis paniculata TaxID=175694 RepID=UPI0021E72E1B|nr:protein KINESIN LIGHT CHAIN-RELATED 3 [Andrographis paniculata]XP_051118657.1 protein KINESIN LIGHT CHAIN-RELATED 3 [Andrographis paniculata]
MRRASSKLVGFGAKSLVPLLSGNSTTATAAAKLNARFLLFSDLKSGGFQAQSQSLNTLAQNAPQVSSRQRRIKEKSVLEEAFESAESVEEMVRAFKEMETASFEEKDLAMACLKIGLKLDQQGDDSEKAASYAQRALASFDEDDVNGRFRLPLAMTLQLLGSSSFKLNRFNDSLGYLNRANRVLNTLGSKFDNDHVLAITHAVQSELFNVKTAMGRREEALSHLLQALEIKERSFEENSKELGKANRDVAEAYVAVLNFKQALPYCSKALSIHISCLGHNSVEVAYDRRLLGLIYTGLDEHEKALEQNHLSQKVLKSWGRSSDLLRAEIDAANMKIALGKYDAAIATLKGVVEQTENESDDRALVLISMAKALFNQDKFADAKRCLQIATSIFDRISSCSPAAAAESFTEISTQYEAMNEFDTAISLLKRALTIFERLSSEQHSVGSVSARIGWLLLLTGKVENAIPYLEDAAERLKESFGAKHYGIGYVYNNLGAAYMELDRPQSAAQAFAYAKDVMDVSLGPHHTDSIEACRNLSKAYAAIGSYPLAINFQEKAVEALEGHGRSAEDEAREAIRVLEELKEKASRCVSEALLDALPPPRDGDGDGGSFSGGGGKENGVGGR